MALADQYAAQAEALAKSIEGIGAASRSSGQDMQGLSEKVLTLGKAFGTWATIEVAKSLVQHALARLKAHRDNYQVVQQEHTKQVDALRQAERYLAALKASVTPNKTLVLLAEERLAKLKETLDATTDELRVHTELVGLYQKHNVSAVLSLATLSAVATMWAATVRSAAELNRALMQTTLETGKRYDLVRRTLEVQGALGASTDSMADSVQALVGYGQDLNANFASNLKLVVMMRDGLGVSAQTAAEMVTIFSQQLQAPVDKVADAIARIAEQTGLAAERMTQFAVETAKALRLLGPGMPLDADKIVTSLGTLAGRIKEAGGTDQTVFDLHRRMAGGGADSYTLRALARVNPRDLGTQEGTQAAMQNLASFIKTMLPANATDPSYPARLQAASELTGIAVDQIETFTRATSSMGQTLKTNKDLTDAYNSQQRLLGQSFSQLKESSMALVKQALVPFLEVLNPLLSDLVSFVQALAASKTVVVVLRIAIPVAAALAVTALTQLTFAIARMAFTSEVGGRMLGAYIPWGSKLIGLGKNIALWGQMASKIGLGGGAAGTAGALRASAATLGGGAVGWLGTGGAVVAAGLVGAVVGRMLDRLMDGTPRWVQLLAGPLGWVKLISTQLGTWYGAWTSASAKPFAYRHDDGVAAVSAAEAASRAVAQSVLTGKGDPSRAIQEATRAAERAFGSRGRELAMRGIEARARVEVVHGIKKTQLAGSTVKDGDDRRTDARFAEMLQKGKMDEQVRALLRIQDSSAISAEAAKQAIRGQQDAERGAAWQSIDSPHTNSPAYRK